jgi:hypothetical protein
MARGCLIACLAALLICGGLAALILLLLTRVAGVQLPARQRAISGSDYQWKTFESSNRYVGSLLELGRIAVADFDGNGADEIFLTNQIGALHFQLDGSRTRMRKPDDAILYGACDVNGDGRWELCHDFGGPTMDLQGRPVGRILDGMIKEESRDLNGDGMVETVGALFQGYEMKRTAAYESNWRLLWELEQNSDRYYCCSADLDGDGRRELLYHDKSRLYWSTLEAAEQVFEGWPADFAFPWYSRDLDGDRIEELICWNGVYNPAGGQPLKLAWPVTSVDEYYESYAALGDFDRDGVVEIVLSPGDPNPRGRVYVFDSTSGACIRQLDLGEEIWEIANARDSAGGEHLVVLTGSRLIVTPGL